MTILTPSRACFDLIKRFEDGSSCATFSLQYLVNDRLRDSQVGSYATNRNSAAAKRRNGPRIGFRQLSGRMARALRQAAPVPILAARVFRQGNPLQIVRSVVQPVAIDMVNRCTLKPSGAELIGYEPVHKIALPPALADDGHTKISTVNPQRINAGFAQLGGLLCAFARGKIRRAPHATKVGNLNVSLKKARSLPYFLLHRKTGVA